MAALPDIPTFRRLFTAQVVSLLGTGLMTVALGLLAFDLAGRDAGTVLGSALAVKMIAYVVMAPVMRAVCARLPARTVMVGADAVRVLMAAALPWVGEVWQIYLLVFALQSASATFTPTFQSVIATVVPDRDDYTRAVSASRIAYDLESVASPMIAAVLLGMMGYSCLFVGTAVGFTASAVLVVTSGLPTVRRAADVGSATVRGFWGRATVGLQIMWSRTALRGLLCANVAAAATTAVVVVGSVVYIRSTLRFGDSMLAVALAVFGAGSVAAALASPRLLRTVTAGRIVVGGSMVCASGLTGLAIMLAFGPELVALLALWLVLGAGTSLITTASMRLLRDHTDDRDRDAVFTAQFSASHAAFLVTYPVAGWGPGVVGPSVTPLLLAAFAAVAGLAALRIWRRVEPSGHDRAARSPTMAGEALTG
ncbi:MFS transporter [Gordonia insulae]|uniref:MFS transporter n=1 Tax=Gordonia insulae TaxID=2420509 RepID=UPI001E439CE7|nr:MFS transporter [Gordonia insulae]